MSRLRFGVLEANDAVSPQDSTHLFVVTGAVSILGHTVEAPSLVQVTRDTAITSVSRSRIMLLNTPTVFEAEIA